MHTKDMLAQELRAVGLNDMADQAASGYYHDYLSPLDMPGLQLINDLATMAGPERDAAILNLRKRAMNGDFDASAEEGDDWAKSPEGQETFGQLMGKKP